MPRGVGSCKMWEQAQAAAKESRGKVEGEDYRLVEMEGKRVAVMLVEGTIPKVHRSAMWISYLNYELGHLDAVAESPFATVCTPYVFNK
ncbi:MAG: hypothetical protein SGPRY_002509 [Prymnesium sp.]